MKFAHLLASLTRSAPEFGLLWGTYKRAKKGIKLCASAGGRLPSASAEFAAFLLACIDSISSERAGLQSKCSTRLAELRVQVASPDACGDPDFVTSLLEAAVHLHGASLLALNYSMLAHTTVLKARGLLTW
jgi:hypothetical protein